MKIIKLLWGVSLGIALSACQTPKHYDDLHGPESSLSAYGELESAKPVNDSTSSDNEAKILLEYANRAGLGLPTNVLPSAGDPRWGLVVKGGLNAIDEQCENYMQAMFWADREMRTAGDNINLLGATTGTLMGVFGGPASAIATSAAAFGLATQALSNESKGLFFEVEPSGVRRIVSRSQVAYRQGVDAKIKTYNSRPAAVEALQGYLTLCLPAHIATQINQAVDSSQFQVQDIKNSQVNVVQKKPDETSSKVDSLDQPVIPPSPPPTEKVIPETNSQDCTNPIKCMTKEEVVHIQKALCISKPSGFYDPKTQQAITFFHQANTKDNTDTQMLDTLGKAGDCPEAQFKNAYERFKFGTKGTYETTNSVQVERLRIELEKEGMSIPAIDDSSLNSLREVIRQFQQEKMPNLPSSDEVTPELITRLISE